MQTITITLTLTVQEAELILASLGKQPLEVVLSLFTKIQKQASDQINPAPEATPQGE